MKPAFLFRPTRLYQTNAAYRWLARIVGGLFLASMAFSILVGLYGAVTPHPYVPDGWQAGDPLECADGYMVVRPDAVTWYCSPE